MFFLSTHHIYFGWEIRKIIISYTLLSGGLVYAAINKVCGAYCKTCCQMGKCKYIFKCKGLILHTLVKVWLNHEYCRKVFMGHCLTFCIREPPNRVLLQTAKTQMKCSIIMLHFIRVYTVCKVKMIFRQKNTIFFLNYNLIPLGMYNGSSQVYCIKPEGIIH